MPASMHTFQAPKGTRDFYPPDLAVRRYVESAWRDVSINHGFDEIDGPTFEHLDLYTVKSGPEIVSELFSFRRAGGDVDYALRPEFTPTLARMYAARANSLPRPTRWFSIGPFFRAERPQRGRLREHHQWNADVIGDPSVAADAQIITVAVNLLERLHLTPRDVRIRISDRKVVAEVLKTRGVEASRLTEALAVLDKRDRTKPADFDRACRELSFDSRAFDKEAESISNLLRMTETGDGPQALQFDETRELWRHLRGLGIAEWCDFDLRIVRGLAYYTGTVFEVHETRGRERAIAGGGRYDNLVELFGGPPTPAVGIAMGDVVIRLILQEHGLLEPADNLVPRPDAFLISAGKPEAEASFGSILAGLRRAGLHVRHSSRATRNVGKLLGDAARVRARCAVILGDELPQGAVAVKNLDTGDQQSVPVSELAETLMAARKEA